MERLPTCALMIAVEYVITGRWFFHLRRHFTLTTVSPRSTVTAPTGCRMLFSGSVSPRPHLWIHTRSCKNTICVPLPAADETIPIARTRPPTVAARSCFPISFICHCSFPSPGGCLSQLVNWFIMLSLLQVGWRMGGWVRWGSILCVCGKVKDLSVALQWWGTYIPQGKYDWGNFQLGLPRPQGQ